MTTAARVQTKPYRLNLRSMKRPDEKSGFTDESDLARRNMLELSYKALRDQVDTLFGGLVLSPELQAEVARVRSLASPLHDEVFKLDVKYGCAFRL